MIATMRICFFGDSFTNGTGDPTTLGWVGRVGAGRGWTIYNLGVRGDSSIDIGRRWRAEALARGPDRMVFSFGANDAAQDIDPQKTLAAAEAMLMGAKPWRPMMIGPLPVSDDAVIDARAAQLCDMLGGLCRRLDVPYLPVFATIAASPLWAREAAEGDGTHPGAAAYAMLADVIGVWLPS